MKKIKRALLDGLACVTAKIRVLKPLQEWRRKILVGSARKVMNEKTFEFNGINLPYSYFSYNSTYSNERAVEVSIGKYFLDTHDDVLEVGNVMSHYFNIKHDVVDKYEKAEGVINEDIVDYVKRHKNVLAISTLEHVGFDEEGKDHTKFFRAIEHIKEKILDGGVFLVTIPYGYNPSVDLFVKSFDGKMTFYYREGREWKVGTFNEIKDKTYGSEYPCANSIAVIEFR